MRRAALLLDRGVDQFGSRAGAAQHESTAAHVAAAYEVDRKKEAVAENFERRVSVLPARDAAEKHVQSSWAPAYSSSNFAECRSASR